MTIVKDVEDLRHPSTGRQLTTSVGARVQLTRIVLPLPVPGLIATGIFCFIFACNELVLAIVLTRDVACTAMLGLNTFVGGQEALGWGVMRAASIIVMVPSVLLAIARAPRPHGRCLQ